VLEAFFARLEAAALPPERVTEDIFRDVGTSRSRFRCLIAALRQFAPMVPLAASAPVKQEWDRWLNERYNKKVPMGRMANEDDLKGPALFLASDASQYLTGVVLPVDGGMSVW